MTASRHTILARHATLAPHRDKLADNSHHIHRCFYAHATRESRAAPESVLRWRRMAQPALFSNQREANLQSTVALVEAVLADLAVTIPSIKASEPGALHAWHLAKGSATAKILLVDRAEFTHLRITATVMTLDARVDRAALHAHLLELNAGLCGSAFATDGDRILLVAERSTLDLDQSEVHDAITRVTTTADDHDDVLVARFGGRLGG